MEQIDLYSQIIETYKANESVKKTAEQLGTSVIKVRRVLITEGLWSSPTSEKICELHNQGLSVSEIAEKLHYTVKNVQAFLPYSRGIYGSNPSDDSVYSKEYRERNLHAAEKLVGSSEDAPKGFVRSEDLTTGEHPTGVPIALKLRLKLNIDDRSRRDWRILHKYGRVDKGIWRDILVPADITLHALHYAIQKLFGWQNSHLHHYAFPEDVFKEVTNNQFARWCSLAGVYFRFPSEEMDDLYWDEDYKPNRSIKSWLRSKYRGPYNYGGLGDYYLENQQNVLALKQEIPSFEVRETFEEFMKNGGRRGKRSPKYVSIDKATVDEFERSIDLGGGLNHLLERLTLLEYLYIPNNNYFLDDLDDKIRYLEEELGRAIYLWNETLADVRNKYELFCQLVAVSTIRMQGKSDKLHYFYDYGDGWEVEISIKKAYYMKELVIDKESDLYKVISGYAPICLEADGLPVMDDVGGVCGYIDFLSTIHESEDEDERRSAREWARSLGWTGRMIKEKNIL